MIHKDYRDMPSWNELRNLLKRRWSGLTEALIDPKVSDQELERFVREARGAQPLPVIWLLGRAQSGKTSIVRTITGTTAAEIGNGYKSCTQTANLYDFPPDAPLLQFLDTRGLGEKGYDPTEDLALCKAQSHVIIAVMRALEPPVGVLLEALAAIRKADPACTIVVAQTCLHDGYKPQQGHFQPYPYGTSPLPEDIPSKLRRSLVAQRKALEKLPGEDAPVCVPIDFTLDGDGFEPVDYGLDSLWDAIEGALPKGLRELVSQEPAVQDLFEREAEVHIRGYALTAAAVGALPAVGAVGVPALQAKMLHSVAAIYGMDLDTRLASEFVTALGLGISVGYLVRYLGRELIKLIPVWGQTGGAAWGFMASGTSTYALGRAVCLYLNAVRGGACVDPDALRKAYAEGLKRAGEFLKRRAVGEHL